MENIIQTFKESAAFFAIWLGAFIVIYLGAKYAEKRFLKQEKKVTGTKYIAYIAIFSALSGILMLFELPLFFAPSFYKLDLSELPVLMCSFYLGPTAGVSVALLKIMVKLLLKGSSTMFVGDFASFLCCCSLVLPASILYLKNKSKTGAIWAMVVGTISLTVFGSLFNAYYLIPTFAVLFKMPVDAIVAMGSKVNPAITSLSSLVLLAVVPFNLLKGSVDSLLTILLYKRLEKVIFK